MIKTPSAIRKAAVFQLDVPLTQLKPGFYTCQVNVIDDAPGQFRTEVGIACEVASTMCTIPLPNNGLGGPPGVSRDQSQDIVLTRPQIMVIQRNSATKSLGITSRLPATYASPRDLACKTRGQDGFAALLSCRALSSPTTCRFIPALSE